MGERAQGDGCVPKVNEMGLNFAQLHIFLCKTPKLKITGDTHTHTFPKNFFMLSSLVLNVLFWTVYLVLNCGDACWK